jgi:hypothetical protein
MSRELDRARRLPAVHEIPELTPTRMPQSPPPGFIRFRYSCTEISSRGQEVHVRMKHTRYQDGKLSSEECEGTLDRDTYRHTLQASQAQAFEQAFGLARALLGAFLGRTGRRD